MARKYPQGPTYRKLHSLGQLAHQMPRAMPQRMGAALPQGPTSPAPRPEPDPGDFVEVPAFYTITIDLGGLPNDQQAGSVPLRPERFECRRITYACQADSPPYADGAFGGSANANCIEITWGDEFTQFLSNQPTLLGALFGQANGFLDLPQGILFQGRQSLNAKLRRLQWPAQTDPQTTRVDITFHGVGLLPVNSGGVSGSV